MQLGKLPLDFRFLFRSKRSRLERRWVSIEGTQDTCDEAHKASLKIYRPQSMNITPLQPRESAKRKP